MHKNSYKGTFRQRTVVSCQFPLCHLPLCAAAVESRGCREAKHCSPGALMSPSESPGESSGPPWRIIRAPWRIPALSPVQSQRSVAQNKAGARCCVRDESFGWWFRGTSGAEQWKTTIIQRAAKKGFLGVRDQPGPRWCWAVRQRIMQPVVALEEVWRGHLIGSLQSNNKRKWQKWSQNRDDVLKIIPDAENEGAAGGRMEACERTESWWTCRHRSRRIRRLSRRRVARGVYKEV